MDPSETYRKKETWTGIDKQKININEQHSYTKGNMLIEQAHIPSIYTDDTENTKQDFHEQSGDMDCRDSATQQIASAVSLNPMATSCEPKSNTGVPPSGQDLWRQLKRVQIPVFSGNKRSYQNWKVMFLA